MKKSIICLLLSCALLLPSCITRREKPPYEEPDITFDFSSLLPLLPAVSELFTDNGLSVKENGEGYTLTDLGKNEDTSVTIPSHRGGKPITEIDKDAFFGASHIEEVILPDTLTSIPLGLFDDCPNLKYNEYNRAQYLGTEDNPYEYLIRGLYREDKSFSVHPDTRVIADYALKGFSKAESITFGDKIEYIGESAFEECAELGKLELPSSLKEIGAFSFRYCRKLTSLNLPKNLKYIGKGAFYVCSALESLILPDSLTHIEMSAFEFCTALKDVIFGMHLEYIGERAFADCRELTALEFCSELRHIGPCAFDYCEKLTDISLPGSIEVIYADSFPSTIRHNINADGDFYLGSERYPYRYFMKPRTKGQYSPNITIEATTKTIARGALEVIPEYITLLRVASGSQYLTTAGTSCIIEKESGRLIASLPTSTIPSNGSVKSIGAYAFTNSDRTSISIPSSVEVIEEYAFYRCENLQTVSLREGLREIGNYAFSGCKALTEINFPKTLTRIGNSAFDGAFLPIALELPVSLTELGDKCFINTRITSVKTPASLKYIPYSCFANTAITSAELEGTLGIGQNAFANCLNLTSVYLPETLTTISNYAFLTCRSLTNLTLPESVTKIGNNAFTACSALKDINIPKSLRIFGNQVFSGCLALSFISLPEVKKTLSANEFARCTGLETLILHKDIEYIDEKAFFECTSLKTVYYVGTRAEWEAIEKHEDWTLGCPEFTVKFTDGETVIPQNTPPGYDAVYDQ